MWHWQGCPHLGTTLEKHFLLLPHEIMGQLHRFRYPEFQRLFEGEPTALRDFWSHEWEQGWARTNPELQSRFCRATDVTAVPVGLHGDDAQYVKNGKLLILSLNGPLCRTSGSRLVLTVLDCARVTEQTLDEIYSVVVWSLKCLSNGAWPACGHLGQSFAGTRTWRAKLANQPLLGGRIGIWSETRGDWKWLKETFRLRHYANKSVCHLCGATKEDGASNYMQTGPGAGWRQLRVTHDEWISSYQADKLPMLARVVGFCLDRVFIDSMHCVDMGCTPYFLGSCLWDLVVCGPAFPEERSRNMKLSRAYADYRAFCQAHDIQTVTGPWTLEKLNRKTAVDFPFLKCKANEAKKALPYVTALCKRLDDGSDKSSWRLAAAWGLCEYYAILDRNGRYLPASELAQLQFAVGTFLRCYAALCSTAQSLGERCWHWVPKHHMFEHIADTVAPQVNPAHASCYPDEDLFCFCVVGNCWQGGLAVCSGPPQVRMPRRMWLAAWPRQRAKPIDKQ